jgi:hypothetical protein
VFDEHMDLWGDGNLVPVQVLVKNSPTTPTLKPTGKSLILFVDERVRIRLWDYLLAPLDLRLGVSLSEIDIQFSLSEIDIQFVAHKKTRSSLLLIQRQATHEQIAVAIVQVFPTSHAQHQLPWPLITFTQEGHARWKVAPSGDILLVGTPCTDFLKVRFYEEGNVLKRTDKMDNIGESEECSG